MEAIINKLLRLNLEIDGYLWVLKTRRTSEAKELLKEKVDEFNALLCELPDLESVNTDLPELETDYREEVQAVYETNVTPKPELPEEEHVSIAPTDPIEATETELPEAEPTELQEVVQEEPAEPDHTESEPAELEPVESEPAELKSAELEPVESEPIVGTPLQPELPEPVEEIPEGEEPKAVEEDQDIRISLVMDSDQEPELSEPKLPETKTDYRVEDMLTRKGAHADLSKAFTLNDKFRFIRGIFCEDKNDFEYTLAQLSEFESLGEVYDYLLNELGWDIDNEEVKDFISIVANHFNDI